MIHISVYMNVQKCILVHIILHIYIYRERDIITIYTYIYRNICIRLIIRVYCCKPVANTLPQP